MAGTNWRKDISNSSRLPHKAILQSDDPDNLCSKWESTGQNKSSNEVAIELNSSKISFKKYRW